MTDFNLEQCKKLKDWGMPQEIGFLDWFEFYDDPNEDGSLGHWESPVFVPRDMAVDDETGECLPGVRLAAHYPSLDELLEFARGLDNQWHLAPDLKTKSWWVEWDPSGPIWDRLEAQGCEHSWHGFEADNPKLAVYALIAKLMEVESEDQQ